MNKSSSSSDAGTASSPIGGDGWFTLLLSTTLIGLMGGITLLILGHRVLSVARLSKPACTSDAELLLVPGMQLLEERPNHDYSLRLERARQLHSQNSQGILIMGGITAGAGHSEAVAGQKFLIERGVPSSELTLEDRSRNTLENLRNVRNLLTDSKITKYALISNRYHLARCHALASGLGMTPELCAAEDDFRAPLSSWPRLLLEAYYLHWYHTGKIWSHITRNRNSLARIS